MEKKRKRKKWFKKKKKKRKKDSFCLERNPSFCLERNSISSRVHTVPSLCISLPHLSLCVCVDLCLVRASRTLGRTWHTNKSTIEWRVRCSRGGVGPILPIPIVYIISNSPFILWGHNFTSWHTRVLLALALSLSQNSIFSFVTTKIKQGTERERQREREAQRAYYFK